MPDAISSLRFKTTSSESVAYRVINLGCVRRIAHDPVEGTAVRDFQMSPVAVPDDAARRQAPERSAHGLKRHSKIFTDIRPFHREIYLGRAFASGSPKVFQQLKEHRDPGNGSFPGKEKRMTLCLTQLVNELADDMELKVGVLRKPAP
nr:hypothetical protein [Bradyrhizobium canariense]